MYFPRLGSLKVLENSLFDLKEVSNFQSNFTLVLPDKEEDEIRQWNRLLKTCRNRKRANAELWIEACLLENL